MPRTSRQWHSLPLVHSHKHAVLPSASSMNADAALREASVEPNSPSLSSANLCLGYNSCPGASISNAYHANVLSQPCEVNTLHTSQQSCSQEHHGAGGRRACRAMTCTAATGCSTAAAASASRPSSGAAAQRPADSAATRRWRAAAAARRLSCSAAAAAATAASTPAPGANGRLSCSHECLWRRK